MSAPSPFDSDDFTRIVPWAHAFVESSLSPGDLAVDLTAGNGLDTLCLWRRVAPSGRVLVFDISKEALSTTAERLENAKAPVFFHPDSSTSPGVHLVHAGHEELESHLDGAPAAVIANLGYLPGGPKREPTCAETTLPALEKALRLLAPGGRIAVTSYVGHDGGEEGTAVSNLFANLSRRQWRVLRLESFNAKDAPFLLLAQKKATYPTRQPNTD